MMSIVFIFFIADYLYEAQVEIVPSLIELASS